MSRLTSAAAARASLGVTFSTAGSRSISGIRGTSGSA